MRYVPSGREKEFISYRNEAKWSYIEFAKQIYRTSVSEYIAKEFLKYLYGSAFPEKDYSSE